MSARVPVLVAAGGEGWEAPALGLLDGAGCTVLKRCVDLADLLATAATGQAAVAVLAGDLPDLDADAVVRLLRTDVRCVAVGGDRDALGRLGVVDVVDPDELESLPGVVVAAGARELVEPDPGEDPSAGAAPEAPGSGGRVVVVHGPGGGPGRTTLAIGLAAEHARSGAACVLVDADPHGGAVAQHLGVLDEVSGLLAAARLVNSGSLDATGFARCRRAVPIGNQPGLEVVTGLPRPDRWIEARPGVLDAILDRGRVIGDVVVDTGFSLEDESDLGRSMSRNQLTLDAVRAADHLVVVGSADPVGLARLARTLVELRDVPATAPVTVVVNRMRDSLGWSEREITGMVEGYLRPAGVFFVPEDRTAADRALVAGRAVSELGDSALRRALARVHETVLAGQSPPISR